MLKSYIPTYVTYLYNDSSDVIKHDNAVFNNNKLVISGTDTFVCDSNDLSKINILERRLRQFGEVVKFTTENKAFNEIQLLDTQDDNYFEVIIHGRYVVKMYKDILIETLISKGIRQGNFIASNFIWGRYNSNMKLIREHSFVYNEILKYEQYVKNKKVKQRELELGKIYQNSKGLYLYLGKVNTASISAIQYYAYNNINDILTYVTKNSKIFDTNLWLYLNNDNINEILNSNLELYLTNTNILNHLSFSKSKKLIETDFNKINVVDNIIDIIRNSFIELYENAPMLFNNFFYTDFRYIVMERYPNNIKLENTLRSIWYD